MSYTTLALLSAMCAAVANVAARTLLRSVKIKDMFSISFLSVAVISLVASPWYFQFEFSIYTVVLILLIIVLDAAGNYFYFQSLQQHEASQITPALSLSPVFAFLASWFVIGLNEPWYVYVLAAVITISVIWFSSERNTHLPWAAIITSACFGLSAIPSKLLLMDALTNPPTLYMLRVTGITMITLLLYGNRVRMVSKQQLGYMILRSLVVAASWILLYAALTTGDVSIVTTLGATTPVFVFILGVLLLKEKLTLKKLVAASLVLILSLVL